MIGPATSHNRVFLVDLKQGQTVHKTATERKRGKGAKMKAHGA